MVPVIEYYNGQLTCYMLVGTESTIAQNFTWYWSYNNQINIQPSSKYSIDSSQTTQSTLTVNAALLNDTGYYYCSVANGYGLSNVRSINMVVKSNLTPIWPFLGALGEAVLLAVIIYFCNRKVKKD